MFVVLGMFRPERVRFFFLQCEQFAYHVVPLFSQSVCSGCILCAVIAYNSVTSRDFRRESVFKSRKNRRTCFCLCSIADVTLFDKDSDDEEVQKYYHYGVRYSSKMLGV